MGDLTALCAQGLENRDRRCKEADSFKTDLLRNWAKLREEETKSLTKSPTKAPTKLPDIKWFPDDKSKSRASEFPTNAATEQKSGGTTLVLYVLY